MICGSRPTITVSERDHVFLADVLQGLAEPQKTLPCKYFYDDTGSRLFEQICEVDEYYLTRTETAILANSAADLRKRFASIDVVVEPGAGSGDKTRILLEALEPPTYVPIDISGEYLAGIADEMSLDYPSVDIVPVAGDFTEELELPESLESAENRLLFFPGSTIGNFTPDQAVSLLNSWKSLVGEHGRILLGVDIAKDAEILEAAYDDQDGVTGRFNLNLLSRINDELGANFDIDAFTHRAKYVPERHRVEMHLVSDRRQNVEIDGQTFEFAEGEHIHTENSHKYPANVFADIVEEAGYEIDHTWTDSEELFNVHSLRLR